MRKLILTFVLVIGLLPCIATAAEKAQTMAPQTTRELLHLCSIGLDNPAYEKMVHYCIAYIDGAVDYHDAMAEHKDMERLICYPSDATLAKGAMAFIEWGNANRKDTKLMSEAAVIGAVRGLNAKWSCGRPLRPPAE
jgi:hypothetical protein